MALNGAYTLEFLGHSRDLKMRLRCRSAMFVTFVDDLQMLKDNRFTQSFLDGSLNFHISLIDCFSAATDLQLRSTVNISMGEVSYALGRIASPSIIVSNPCGCNAPAIQLEFARLTSTTSHMPHRQGFTDP